MRVYVSGAEAYSGSLYLPLICIGLLVGFGVVYGMWHRTRSEWTQILTEGVVPYLLSIAGLFVLIGLVATPMVARPKEFIESIAEVNLVGDGTVESRVTIPAISADTEADEAPFVPANISYNLRSSAEVVIESDRTIYLSDSADPALVLAAAKSCQRGRAADVSLREPRVTAGTW